MITRPTLQFLKELRENNRREWFDPNRDRYRAAASEFETCISLLIPRIARFDEGIAGLTAPQCIFRFYRDVRFSRDKSPYKTHLGAWMVRGGRKSEGAGYYVHIEPGGSFLAGGAYMPEKGWLLAIRQEIQRNGDELIQIIEGKNFKKQFPGLEGERLQRPPQGFSPDDPYIELLKHKSLLASHRIPDSVVLSQDFAGYCETVFRALHPLNAFLNRPLRK